MSRKQMPACTPIAWPAIAAATAALVARGDRTKAEAFEAVRALLAGHFSSRSVLGTDTGTGALQLALRAAGARAPGAPVALPAYCCYDVATAAVGAGVPVLFYDLDSSTLGPDLASIDDALRRGARAVVVAHLFGLPADVCAVRDRAARADALVIEDAAQGLGATLDGAPLGSLGSLGVLSFGRGKGVTAGGGGALLVMDEEGTRALAAAAVRLEPGTAGWGDWARLVAQWLLGRPSLYGLPAALPFLHLGETVYHPPRVTRSLSPAAARALVGVWPLGLADVATRQKTAAILLGLVRHSRLLAVEPILGAQPGYLRLPVLLPPDEGLDLIPTDLGVARAYPRTLSELAGLRDLPFPRGGSFTGAEMLATRLCTLPTHSRLSETDLEALGRWIARRS